ncbi:uncharacterized protein BDW47DRAFT_15283 [Aspergillus candidus]|uniref:Uncharacterized protein n=1 Tax=Aspergillus candidus TaxID=41067 RepID=A0A2I2FFI1_ASPCN|nr:hypothetical protein BDW47DRAFT_15283 [Aspergillus candidus]PLB39359.1 hypothetical protein BDW47DRAFT_15283 [Aspergillus candidus]
MSDRMVGVEVESGVEDEEEEKIGSVHVILRYGLCISGRISFSHQSRTKECDLKPIGIPIETPGPLRFENTSHVNPSLHSQGVWWIHFRMLVSSPFFSLQLTELFRPQRIKNDRESKGRKRKGCGSHDLHHPFFPTPPPDLIASRISPPIILSSLFVRAP